MDETSDPHMETDVSSTTEDVPEMQEVTGSNGNVVLIVEKIDEETVDSNPKSKEQPAQVSEATSPSKVPKPQMSPQKESVSIAGKTPNKPPLLQKIVLKRPSNPKVAIDQMQTASLNNKQSKPVAKTAPQSTHSEGTIDSSSKVVAKKSPSKFDVEVSKIMPLKDVDVEITIRKVANMQPTRKSTDISPTKEKSSPNTETAVKDVPNTIFVQKSTVKTPTKEQVEPQKSIQKTPIKDQQIVPKTLNKTPTKELAVEPPKTSTEDVAVIEKVNGNIEDGEDQPLSNNNSVPVVIVIENDASTDSQLDSLDTTEKDHNKSISRELKSLINSAKESKIISECTQLTSKTRKSRTPLDSSNTQNTSLDSDKIQGNRRISTNSQKSNSSEKSDKTTVKRSMRSQNPEFVNKVKQFLISVTKIQKDSDDGTDEEMEDVKNKDPPVEIRATNTYSPKKKKIPEVIYDSQDKSGKLRNDPYCWRCHWVVEHTANEKTHSQMHCTVCPRTYHYKCLSGAERNKINIEKSWVCPECISVLNAESSETRSPAMKKISLGVLCELLKFALERMMDLNGVEPFMQPVDGTAFPDYDKYVVHPMDLSLLKENITSGLYGSTEAFLADAQWILHNSIIFNTHLSSTVQSKLTGGARALVRSCRAEMGEIEACPECYKAAHARRPTWFTDVCTTPHVLLWAKLKGFPYWPAKGMSVNNAGLVDVRFFGAHDRAWVPAKDCFLYSEKDPNNFRTKRQDILDSMQEAEQHIRNISRKYGKFVYPPFKSQLDPAKLTEQIKMMIPSFEGEVRSAIKEKTQNSSPSISNIKNRSNSSRSNSKSSKEGHDGDTSEGEDTSTQTRKMADGAEIAREEDYSIDKDKTTDVDVTVTPAKENETSRKRRHSQLEEAVLTVIETSVKEKRKKVEQKEKSDDKTDAEPNSSKDVEMKVVESKKTDKPIEKTDNTPKMKEKTLTPVQISLEKQKPLRVAPIKIITTPKGNRTAIRSSTPKIKLVVKKPSSVKRLSIEKSGSKEERKEKRRNSRNKSLNSSFATPGKDKVEKKNDKSIDSSIKDKPKDTANKPDRKSTDKALKQSTDTKAKLGMQFDDNTSLALLARKSKGGENDVTGLPTISSVISLSTAAQSTKTTTSKPTTTNKSIEITVEPNSNCSVFTPAGTDNARNMKQAASQLQKLRSGTDQQQSLVGKVGVRAFARMTSPPMKTVNKNVEVEIKAEPIDLDDPERHLEKMEVMNAFHLRPVNPPPTNLRDVRINKLVVGPVPTVRRGKVVEVRPRAKKTFPQPPRPADGRSELNGKNSMVYIPIQPAATPGPPRPRAAPPAAPPVSAPLVVTTTASSVLKSSPLVAVASTSAATVLSTGSPIQSGPTVGQATVHTVPLITSVNGQWTLALQPVMSVGGVDGDSPPMVNGTPERVSALSGITNMNIASMNSVGSLANVTSVTGITNLAGIPNMAGSVAGASGAVPIAAAVVAPSAAPAGRTNDAGSTPGEPPRLQQRPALLNPLDARTPIGNVPVPSTAGPFTAKLNQNAVKLADFFRTLLEDSLEHLDDPDSQIAVLKLQVEQLRWRHQQEIDEVNHNHELTLAEMRSSFEKERTRMVSEVRRAAQAELEAAVSQAKAKQWCANCGQEAQFYCCWNTSYCDYPCQRAHWAQHFAVCTQKRTQDGDNNGDSSNTSPPERLQPQPENLPKNTPVLTAPTTAKARPQQDSIIMSVMEDASGNQTLKCLGTYKAAANANAPTQLSPVLLNKQIVNSEDNSKKVVTTGGYLIVGAGVSNSTSIVTQPRRNHTIQYYT